MNNLIIQIENLKKNCIKFINTTISNSSNFFKLTNLFSAFFATLHCSLNLDSIAGTDDFSAAVNESINLLMTPTQTEKTRNILFCYSIFANSRILESCVFVPSFCQTHTYIFHQLLYKQGNYF